MRIEARCSNCNKELQIKRSQPSLNPFGDISLEIEPCVNIDCIEKKVNIPVNYTRLMKEFHKIFEVPMSNRSTLLGAEDAIRRLTLIMSEVGELGDWVRQKNIVEIADALGDLLYVTFGMSVEMGLDIDRIFKEIHSSNMTKANEDGSVTKDAGGKVLKSERYKPVDLSWIKKNETNN